MTLLLRRCMTPADFDEWVDTEGPLKHFMASLVPVLMATPSSTLSTRPDGSYAHTHDTWTCVNSCDCEDAMSWYGGMGRGDLPGPIWGVWGYGLIDEPATLP